MANALRRAGILGINQRNVEFTIGENPRRLYPLVDDKLATKALCEAADIPTAAVVATARAHSEVSALVRELRGRSDFVLKPAHGAMGNGILVIGGVTEAGWKTTSGRALTERDIHYHATSIISGMFALGGQPDVAFAEERLEIHPDLRSISCDGVPDIRIVTFRGVPVMSMTRLPTARSDGKASLHQGAVGAGIDMTTGCTSHAVIGNTPIEHHPDTGERVVDRAIPAFEDALRIAIRAGDQTGLGYVGADVVVDAKRGPVLLELNARPGLAIQIANRAGLLPRLQRIRASQLTGMDAEARIALGRRIAEECSHV